MTIGPEWLQWGSFGVMVLVLFAVGVYIKKRDEKAQEIAAERDKKAQEVTETKDKQVLDFMQSLIQQSQSRQDAHEAAWQKMTADVVLAQTNLATVMAQLSEQLEAQVKCLEAHDRVVVENQKSILTALGKKERNA